MEVKLTERETEVLGYLVTGMPNKLIAQKLNISNSTVHFHVQNILRKLGVHNRTAAAGVAIGRGLVGE